MNEVICGKVITYAAIILYKPENKDLCPEVGAGQLCPARILLTSLVEDCIEKLNVKQNQGLHGSPITVKSACQEG